MRICRSWLGDGGFTGGIGEGPHQVQSIASGSRGATARASASLIGTVLAITTIMVSTSIVDCRKYLQELRPNALWWLILVIAGGLGGLYTRFRGLYLAMPLSSQVLLVIVIVLAITCLIQAIALRRLRATQIRIVLPSGEPAEVPAMLIGKRESPSPGSHSLDLRMVADTRDGNTGLLVFLHNSDLKPLKNCQLVLVKLGTYHKEKQAFREPNFRPRIMVLAAELQPDQISTAAWLAKTTSPEMNQLFVAEGMREPGILHRATAIWKAEFHIKLCDTARREALYFAWVAGEKPEFIEDRPLPRCRVSPREVSVQEAGRDLTSTRRTSGQATRSYLDDSKTNHSLGLRTLLASRISSKYAPIEPSREWVPLRRRRTMDSPAASSDGTWQLSFSAILAWTAS